MNIGENRQARDQSASQTERESRPCIGDVEEFIPYANYILVSAKHLDSPQFLIYGLNIVMMN